MILKELHKKSGLKRSFVAEKLDINKATFAGYLDSDNIPSVQNLVKLAKFYNVSIEYLLGVDKEEIFTEQDKQILNVYNSATEQQKKEIIAYATGLTGMPYNFNNKGER